MSTTSLTRSSRNLPSLARDFDMLQRDIRRMFESPFAPGRDLFDWDFAAPTPLGVIPPVEITETNGELRLSAELPGMRREDVAVEIDGDILTLRGEKQEQREEEDKADRKYHVVERTYGAFQRSFTLPRTVDAEKVKATYDNGVLTVTIPKSKEAKARGRRIAVESK